MRALVALAPARDVLLGGQAQILNFAAGVVLEAEHEVAVFHSVRLAALRLAAGPRRLAALEDGPVGPNLKKNTILVACHVASHHNLTVPFIATKSKS